MSNLVFPMPAPPAGSWAWPVKKTPSGKTVVQMPASNRGENRIALAPNPIYLFDYDFSYLKGDYQTLNSAIANLVGFYNARHQAADDWLFQDPYDNGQTALPLVNGNFEQSASLPPPGWTQNVGATLSYDTTTQYEGVRSLIVSAFGGHNASSSLIPIQGGQTISASCFSKFLGGGSTTGAIIFLFFYDSSGSTVLSSGNQTTANSDWTPLSIDLTAPLNAAFAQVLLGVNGGSSNGQAEFDLVTLSAMTLGPQTIGFSDGTLTQFQIGRTLAFGGFEMMQNVFPTALFLNGVQVPAGPQPSGNQWYCGLENWLLNSQNFTGTGWQDSNVSVTANAATAPDGTTTANKITTVGTSGMYNVFQSLTPSPFSPGDVLTLSAWFLLNTAGLQGQLALFFTNANGVIIGQAVGTATPLTSGWRRLFVTGTVPLGTTGILAAIYIKNTSTNGNSIYSWGAQLERWTSPTSYVATTSIAPLFPRGLVTFTSAPALAAVTADFSYYYRCRFLEDEWPDLEEFMFQLWEQKSLKFKSLIL